MSRTIPAHVYAFVLLLASAPIAFAQIVTATPATPEAKTTSPGGVDMRTGNYVAETIDLSIGPTDLGGFTFIRVPHRFKNVVSNWHYKVSKIPNPSGGQYYQIENKAIARTFFTANNGVSFSEAGVGLADGISGLQMFGTSPNKYLIFTAPDATTTRFGVSSDGANTWAQEIKRPDGITYNFDYDAGGPSGDTARVRRVSSNTGYQLILEYYASPNNAKMSKVCVINAAFTTPPVAPICPAGARSVSYTYSGVRVASVTDAAGAVSTITNNYVGSSTPYQESFYKPGMSQPWLTNSYTLDQAFGVTLSVGQQSFAGGRVIAYNFDYVGHGDLPGGAVLLGLSWTENSASTTQIHWKTYQANANYIPAVAGPDRITDPLGRATLVTYDPSFTKVVSSSRPSGLKATYSYNGNRSITQTKVNPAPGSDPELNIFYTYDCTVAVNCKKPATYKDARGNTTNYTYDAVHGGLLLEILPAPTLGALRPEKRYTWAQYYAWYRNTAGTLVQAATPVWLVSAISTCRTLTPVSCLGTADETRTTFFYGSSGSANNLLVTQKVVAAGDGSISSAAAFTYSANGDNLSEDGPLPGSADTTVWKYDLARRVVGVVGPDPDGAGPLKFRAKRTTYDAAGRDVRVERGTVLGQSDVDWQNFVPLDSTETEFNALDQPVKITKYEGGVAYAVSQISYDTFGRVDCSAVRLNSTAFGNLPSDACMPSNPGAHGPDRITRRFYDSSGQLTKTQVAVGTADVADDRSITYTSDGLLETETDGENNRTTYEYDGHDRLKKIRYPDAVQGALSSSTTDFEQFGYDENGNVNWHRLRDSQVINDTIDTLSRVTTKALPAGETPVTYDYDLQGNLLSATQGLLVTSQAWDALGRLVCQMSAATALCSTPSSSATRMTYDSSGRLVRLTYADGYYATYAYNVVDIATVLENGSTTLATFAHDDFGRRTSLTRGNNAATSYSYLNSRLANLTQDIAGASLVVSGISYNPAAQIVSLVRSNDSYAWRGHYNLNLSYGVSGSNALTNVGSTQFGYDARGNPVQTGVGAYSYSSENQLVTGSGGVSVSYDPLGRISKVSQGTPSTVFEYVGSRLIAERDASGAIVRRYVHGPAEDEPLVWYEGSGISDRRYLHADERGSVIAVTNGSGGILGINSFDEYGTPGSSNIGRFQYTGQTWIPELQLAYYKARMYSPHIGRFMQTDPIGYRDGLNLYSYVGNDPINLTDPSGLAKDCKKQQRKDNCWLIDGFESFGNAMIQTGNFTASFTDYIFTQPLMETSNAFTAIVTGNGSSKDVSTIAKNTALTYSGVKVEQALGEMIAAIASRFAVAAAKPVTMPVSRLQMTHGKTMRKNEFREVLAKYAKDGITEPVKYVEFNGTNYVVDGNHRILAARQLGITDVPAERVTLPFGSFRTTADLDDGLRY